MRQRFLYIQKPTFNSNRQKTKNFRIVPHCENRPLWQRHVYRHDVAKVGNFNNGSLCGNVSLFVGSN